MSDVAQGPGWWEASDGRWYPPETLAQAMAQIAPAPEAPPPDHLPAAGPFPGATPWPDAVVVSWRQSRAIAMLLVLLGLAGVVWGVGELLNAVSVNASPLYPRDEQLGAWLVSGGILLAGVTTIVMGLVWMSRRP